MARTLSSLVTTLKNTNVARIAHLFKVVAGATTFRFTDLPQDFTFAGAVWNPYLAWDGQIRYTRGLDIDGGIIKLSNVDLTMAQNIRDTDFEGATGTLQQYFLDAEEAVTIFQGRVVSVQVGEDWAEFKVAGELDPTALSFPKRDYSALCPWKFKGTECGYTDGVDPNDPGTGLPFVTCPKDFSACTARGRTHRFGGFVHVTRDLTEAVGGMPGGGTPGGSGDSPGDWPARGLELP